MARLRQHRESMEHAYDSAEQAEQGREGYHGVEYPKPAVQHWRDQHDRLIKPVGHAVVGGGIQMPDGGIQQCGFRQTARFAQEAGKVLMRKGGMFGGGADDGFTVNDSRAQRPLTVDDDG